MSETFVSINFENANDKRTEEIMLNLEDAGIGYTHITGNTGWLLGAVADNLDYETFVDKAENVVHDHNGGVYVGIEKRTYKDVEHLL